MEDVLQLHEMPRPENRSQGMIRVLHVAAGNLFGGVESMLVTLARHRAACPGMEQQFSVCFSGLFQEKLAEAGARVHNLGSVSARFPWTILRGRRRLKTLLMREGIDVAIFHGAWAAAMLGSAASATGKLLAVWIHNPPAGKHWLERWASRAHPQLAICNSEFTASSLENLYAKVSSRTLLCPVELDDHPIDAAQRNAIRERLEVPPGAAVIIQVSRMESWKGHDLHLRALAQMKTRSDWRCWIVGGGQRPAEVAYAERMQTEAASLGIGQRVRFLGQRTDVRALLAAADLFCQPNEGPEPFGIAFVEALAARLPVVTTGMGGAKEIVDDTCGILVEPGNVKQLAEALASLVDNADFRERLGQAGPNRAQVLCSPQDRICDLKNILAARLSRK